MIDRYTLPEMGRVWSEAHKYELWCQVETLVLEAHARAGTVPADAVGPVRAAPPPTPEAVAEVEAVTEHDVIAFLTAWADNTEPRSAAAYVHYGMTSSDLLDTALALQLVEATDLILAKADRLGGGRGDPGPAPPPHAALRADARHPRGTRRLGTPGGRLRVRGREVKGPGAPRARGGRGRQAVRAGWQVLEHPPGGRGRGHAGAPGP